MEIGVIFDETIFLLNKVKDREITKISAVAHAIYRTFQEGGKLLICGNGGSAADAQHMSAEFINRFRIERTPLPAIALTTDTSVITSISNDYSFYEVFSKQVLALGREGDILLGITTSGKSPNILKALEVAKGKGMITVGLSGDYTEEMNKLCDYYIHVPSKNTPRIQEVHLLIEHVICEIVDNLWRKDHV
ncbi:MAG: D-sedoheptulose 7-phosphate isomerase [Proteobacteria bacterium]|nr:D-sedoheptulose 7-phosphate isomerase [Pseudomonadota bacterium]